MQKETVLLPLLSRKLEVAIPAYRYIWAGNRKHPRKFAGYGKIPGISCAEAGNVSDAALGEDLGHFLTQLHTIQPSKKVLELIPRYTPEAWAKSRTAFYQRIKKLVYPVIDAPMRNAAEDFWARSIEQLSHSKFEPTLIHSDMRAGNIILDAVTSRLNGIVDWDDAAIGDPALDFMGAFEVSERLGALALKNYGRDASGYLERVWIYLQTVPFGEVAWGVRTGSKRLVKDGMRHLNRLLSAS